MHTYTHVLSIMSLLGECEWRGSSCHASESSLLGVITFRGSPRRSRSPAGSRTGTHSLGDRNNWEVISDE
jgi:hypothetical protein